MPKIKLKNISLYYEVKGEGYPLLLIAGLNSDNASWLSIRDALARDFRVIVFDNRSSGRSDYPKSKYSIRDMADDAVSLLKALGVEKCDVIGHSMGGYIAQLFAVHYPRMVRKLVLEATSPVSSFRNIELFRDFHRRLKKEHSSVSLMRLWACWAFSLKTFEDKKFVPQFIELASKYPYLQREDGFKKQIDAMAAFNAVPVLKKIKAKTLVMIGDEDIIIYPRESMRLAGGIKKSKVARIKDTGHCVHVENPEAFVSAVLKFLR